LGFGLFGLSHLEAILGLRADFRDFSYYNQIARIFNGYLGAIQIFEK